MRRLAFYVALLAVSILLLWSCKYSENFRLMESQHYTIEIPPYLSKALDIRPGASVQGRNNYRDVYIIVYEHDRSDEDSSFLVRHDSIAHDILKNLRDPFVEADTSFQVNELPVLLRRYTGIINDKRLVFLTALVRGRKADYEISGWMFDHKRDLWLDDLEKSISTFREK